MHPEYVRSYASHLVVEYVFLFSFPGKTPCSQRFSLSTPISGIEEFSHCAQLADTLSPTRRGGHMQIFSSLDIIPPLGKSMPMSVFSCLQVRLLNSESAHIKSPSPGVFHPTQSCRRHIRLKPPRTSTHIQYHVSEVWCPQHRSCKSYWH